MWLCFMGAIFVIVGTGFKTTNKKRNYSFGWKTKFATKNRETWKEAQRFGGNLFIIFGAISLISGYIIYKFYPGLNMTAGNIGLIFLVIIFAAGEIHLRRVFDKDGNWKKSDLK